MTPWERAVEAAREAKSSSGSVNGVCACSDCDEHRRAILLAAAPHLERHFREKLAEELRALGMHPAIEFERGVLYAADHLTRKEVMG